MRKADDFVAPDKVDGVGRIFGKPLMIRLIPNAQTEGDFESLCLPVLLQKWRRAKKCVPEFLHCTGADKWSKKSSINKARARAVIVGFNQEDPYKGIGYLFAKKVLSVTHKSFDDLADYLRGFDALIGYERAL